MSGWCSCSLFNVLRLTAKPHATSVQRSRQISSWPWTAVFSRSLRTHKCYVMSNMMAQGSPNAASPVSNKGKSVIVSTDVIPLDAPHRTEPIHALLPWIKLPTQADGFNVATLNPLTLKPFTAEELKTHNFVKLKEQYSTPEDAKKAQEEAIRELKERFEENERKTKEIEREMEEKEKTREIERKVYNKKLGKDGSG